MAAEWFVCRTVEVKQRRRRGQWSAVMSSLPSLDQTDRADVALCQRTRSTTSMVSTVHACLLYIYCLYSLYVLVLTAQFLSACCSRRQRCQCGGHQYRRCMCVAGWRTMSARRLRPSPAMHRLTGPAYWLQYNRDKIVYTCAIVANIRGRGNVWSQVGRELGGFSFTTSAMHLIRPTDESDLELWDDYATCELYDITLTFPQHASLVIHTLDSTILIVWYSRHFLLQPVVAMISSCADDCSWCRRCVLNCEGVNAWRSNSLRAVYNE